MIARNPVVLVVVADAAKLDALARELEQRYAAGYRVLTAPDSGAALGLLERLRAAEEEVALVIASQGLPGLSGVELLTRARDLHPGAKRSLLISFGDAYRWAEIPSVDALVGAGVFYGAASSEARAMTGREVFVVGAGNAAGQAALNLARYAARVTLLVRGDGLERTMSDYLVREIGRTPRVEVRFGAEVVAARGRHRLEGLVVRDRASGATSEEPAVALFLFIGAVPHTDWLRGAIALDAHGFVLTGADVPASAAARARPPFMLETSLDGVFAAGDARAGSIKRVAAAVGEGSMATAFVHQYLAQEARAVGS